MADALKILESHSQETPINIFGVLQDVGLRLEFRPESENISGWIEPLNGDGYLVVINERHSATRQRFTAAHELGHYIYHRDLLGRGVGDTRAYRSAGTPLPNTAITIQHERQANTFAANVLMPYAQIARFKGQGVTDPRELAKLFLVSEEAMRIRLGLPRHASLF